MYRLITVLYAVMFIFRERETADMYKKKTTAKRFCTVPVKETNKQIRNT